MAAITAELDLEIQKFRKSIQNAQRLAGNLKGKAVQTGKDLGPAMFASMVAAGNLAANALTGIFNSLGRQIRSVISGSIQTAAEFEQTSIAFEVLIGGADAKEQTAALLRDLRSFAEKTPLQLGDISEASRKLLAFGTAAKEVPDILQRIGDISTAIQQPIGEIAELYGKAKVQGRLFGDDINRLTGRGIPVIQEFAKQLGVAEENIKEMVAKGAISFDNLEQAFVDLTAPGARFGGMMEKQAGTAGGLWSTLIDNFQSLRLAMGQPIVDVIGPMLQQAIGLVASLKDRAAQIGKAIAGAIEFINAAFRELSSGDMIALVGDALILAFKSAVNFLWSAWSGAWAAIGTLIAQSVKNTIGLLAILTTKDFWSGLWNALKAAAQMFTALMMDAAASLWDAIAKIPGLGDYASENAERNRSTADRLKKSAAESGATAKDKLTPAFGAAQKALADTASAVAASFRESFAAAGEAVSTEKERAAIAEKVAAIEARIASDRLKGADAEKNRPGGPVPVFEDDDAGGKRLSVAGAAAGAISALTGGSAQKLIAVEAKIHTRLLTKIAENTAQAPQEKGPLRKRAAVFT